jgi:hypothetical protein
MNDSIKNTKLTIAVMILHMGQHQILKQEQQVTLQAMHSHVTSMIMIGKKRASPYNHGEMQCIAVSIDVKVTSGYINDGTAPTIIAEYPPIAL